MFRLKVLTQNSIDTKMSSLQPTGSQYDHHYNTFFRASVFSKAFNLFFLFFSWNRSCDEYFTNFVHNSGPF